MVRERNRVQSIPSAFVQGRLAFQILQQAPRLVPLFPIGSYTPRSRWRTPDQSNVVQFFAAWSAMLPDKTTILRFSTAVLLI